MKKRESILGGSQRFWGVRSTGILIFLIALGVRLVYLAEQARSNPLFDTPVVDAQVYSAWASEIVAGQWWWPGLRNYLPVYPWFLAICQWFLYGDNPWSVKIVQSLLSSIACVLLASVTRRLFGLRAGVFAGLLFATNWMFVVYDAERYSESLCLFLLVVCIHQLLCTEPGWRRTVVAGLACAAACACRPNLIPLILVCAGWVFVTASRRSDAVRHAAVFIAMAAAIFLPVAVHNHHETGRWMLRAQQSWNFYAALDPSIGGLHPAAGIAFDQYMLRPVSAGFHDSQSQDIYWKEEARHLLREQPGPALYNFFVRRGIIFLSATEWSQEFDVNVFRSYSRLLRLPLPGFGWIFPLACAGLVATFAGKRSGAASAEVLRMQHFLLLCLVTVAIFTFLGKVTGRYRLPMTLMLTPFAAAGIDRLLCRDPRRNLALFAVLGAGILICWPDWAGLTQRQTALHDYYVGMKYQRDGRADLAEAALRNATRNRPANPDAFMELGRVLWRQGQMLEAMVAVSEALRLEPDFWKAWNLKGSLEAQLKQHDAALASLERSLKIYPLQAEPWMIKSRVFADMGRWDEEKAAFESAIDRGAGASFIAAYGLRLEERREFQGALKQYLAIAEDPGQPRSQRAQACMLAARLFAAELKQERNARILWEKCAREFSEAGFFSDQAAFLMGALPEEQYRERVERSGSPSVAVFFDYNRGLWWLMRGESGKAKQAFEACLVLAEKIPEDAGGSGMLPAGWAREALRKKN